MCNICPQGKDKTEKEMERTSCDGIWNKIDCFQQMLYDRKLIYVPNGSTRIAINERLYNFLKQFSTDDKERKSENMNIPKPNEVAMELIKERLKTE